MRVDKKRGWFKLECGVGKVGLEWDDVGWGEVWLGWLGLCMGCVWIRGFESVKVWSYTAR